MMHLDITPFKKLFRISEYRSKKKVIILDTMKEWLEEADAGDFRLLLKVFGSDYTETRDQPDTLITREQLFEDTAILDTMFVVVDVHIDFDNPDDELLFKLTWL